MPTTTVLPPEQLYDVDRLVSIGKEMSGCRRSCPGTRCRPEEGIIPRCLFLEKAEDPESPGSIVVGLNPGSSSEAERKFYREQGPTYESTVQYWETKLHHTNFYYTRMRELLHKLHRSGPILWTELVKCETDPKAGSLPQQTYRVCTTTFLQEELECVPSSWPIFAVGREAYKAASYVASQRAVIGVPHPTGSRGHFAALGVLRQPRPEPWVVDDVAEALGGLPPQAKWLRAPR